MKKVFNSFLLLLFSLVIFYSCSKQNNSIAIKPQTSSELLATLNAFNQSRPHIEGFWSNVGAAIGNACIVVGADIAGAAGGVKAVGTIATALNVATAGSAGTALVATAGVICAAGASYGSIKVIDKELRGNGQSSRQSIVPPFQYSYLKDFGKKHNEIMCNYYFNNIPINNYYNTLPENQLKFLSNPEFESIRSKFEEIGLKYAQDNFNFKNLTQNFQNSGYISLNVKTVLDVFFSEYVKSNSSNEIDSLINFYINSIANSDLDEIDKEALIKAFLVASESPYCLKIE